MRRSTRFVMRTGGARPSSRAETTGESRDSRLFPEGSRLDKKQRERDRGKRRRVQTVCVLRAPSFSARQAVVGSGQSLASPEALDRATSRSEHSTTSARIFPRSSSGSWIPSEARAHARDIGVFDEQRLQEVLRRKIESGLKLLVRGCSCFRLGGCTESAPAKGGLRGRFGPGC